MKLDTIKLIGLLTILLCFAAGTTAWAAIPDDMSVKCKVCHEGGMGGVLKDPYKGNEGCVTCHSSDTYSTTYDLDVGMMTPQYIKVPVVVFTDSSLANDAPILAGGNFWWVKGPAGAAPNDWAGGADDRKGHNIFTGEGDDNLSVAPGASNGIGCGENSCHENLDQAASADPARQGCTGCHMMGIFGFPSGYHHKDDTGPVIDTAAEGWFRFLDGHQAGYGLGVCGIEDPDWQASSGPGDHNEYLGHQSTGESAGSFSACGNTVTGFCSGCHGNFHIRKCYGEAHQPEPCYGDWIRHGVGVELCPDSLIGCEMAGYTIYDPQTPVARPDLTGWTEPSATVNPETDMANCLSCHRAHGSPYPKMLRWDMTDTTKACATCHTSLKKE